MDNDLRTVYESGLGVVGGGLVVDVAELGGEGLGGEDADAGAEAEELGDEFVVDYYVELECHGAVSVVFLDEPL